MEGALIIKNELSTNCDADIGCRSVLKKTNIVERQGFKPSDCQDNAKRQFLIELSKQIWIKDSITSTAKNIDLKKLYTPAMDTSIKLPKQKKLFSSSVFYTPALHPTMEEQIALARIISSSLTDVNNQKSKGQSMYMQRKSRSAKWVYESVGSFQGNDCDAKSNEAYERNNQWCKNSNVIIKGSTVPTNNSRNFRNEARKTSVTESDFSMSTVDMMSVTLPPMVIPRTHENYSNSTPLSVLNRYTNIILEPKRRLAYRPCTPKGWKHTIVRKRTGISTGRLRKLDVE